MKATEKQKAYFKQYFLENKKTITGRRRRHYQEHIEDRLAKHSYYLLNKEHILQQRKNAKTKQYNIVHREERLARTKNWAQKLREEVITHYTQGENSCRQCHFNDIRALSIDHILGGGNQHRKQMSGNFCYQLKRQGFPEGYQILCMNCQFIKKEEKKENRWKK